MLGDSAGPLIEPYLSQSWRHGTGTLYQSVIEVCATVRAAVGMRKLAGPGHLRGRRREPIAVLVPAGTHVGTCLSCLSTLDIRAARTRSHDMEER